MLRLHVQSADGEMNARRATAAEEVHQFLNHATAETPPLRPGEQIDVEVRRVRAVRLRAEVIGMVIDGVDLLHARPLARAAARLRESLTERRPPLPFVAIVEAVRIERTEGVAADAE